MAFWGDSRLLEAVSLLKDEDKRVVKLSNARQESQIFL